MGNSQEPKIRNERKAGVPSVHSGTVTDQDGARRLPKDKDLGLGI